MTATVRRLAAGETLVVVVLMIGVMGVTGVIDAMGTIGVAFDRDRGGSVVIAG